ncbi:MAG: TetR/AcrR family transcriptional regulator [Cytophagales bacterium]|nr:TetR/AcrR family transcriptional regulator [Cytophagales bacterium]
MRNSKITRQLIIRKSLPIFNTKGYHATSLTDITNATGITKGAIYGNFKNKDEVAFAAYEFAGETVLAHLTKQVRAQATAPLKLKAIVNYFSDYVNNPPIKGGCPIINTAVEADDNYPMLRSKVIRTITRIKESIAKMIYRGIKECQIIGIVDVEEFTAFFFSTIQGAVLVSRVEGDNRSYIHTQQILLRMIEEISE